jgi:hypothetical protein
MRQNHNVLCPCISKVFMAKLAKSQNTGDWLVSLVN